MEDFSVMMSWSISLIVFHPYEDVAPGGDGNIDEATYYVKIRSVRLFKMSVGFISKGAALRGTSHLFWSLNRLLSWVT